jgi:hypothetical protein
MPNSIIPEVANLELFQNGILYEQGIALHYYMRQIARKCPSVSLRWFCLNICASGLVCKVMAQKKIILAMLLLYNNKLDYHTPQSFVAWSNTLFI